MATEKALEDGFGSEAGLDTGQDGEIDQAIDDLRGILKKGAGEAPATNDEIGSDMGGAAAFGSDFGADFAADTAEGLDDPFASGDAAGALAGGFEMPAGDIGGVFGAREAGLDEFSASAGRSAGDEPGFGASGTTSRLDMVLDIPVDVQVVLGASRMAVSELMDLSEGATIALDRRIGEPVEIMVNGKPIGRGEITVLENDETRFGIRMIEVFGEPAGKG